jgi:hypothetical protein
MLTAAVETSAPMVSALRARIGWVCRALQFLVVAHPLWVLWIVVHYWGDRAYMDRYFLDFYKLDVSGASQGQFAAAIGVHLAVFALMAGMFYCLWRVLDLYLRGRVFTIDAASWLRRAGLLGLVTTLADIGSRSAIVCVMTDHLPSSADKHHGFVTSDDPIHLILALIVIAFASVQKSAADIADENAQIV